MKIYELYMSNDLTYEDHIDVTKWIVAVNEEEAKVRGEKELEDFLNHNIEGLGSYWIEEVTEIDGYEIVAREKRNYAKGSNYFN